ncbi:MAG: class I SAM-dependent methyltransferase [Candidatus Omnitrophica bacterium]|nr:class I SAM-dependent methyltransferase [Candidatus Omnitrophota bacterium]
MPITFFNHPFFHLPPLMRAAYVQNMMDHLLPGKNLLHLLKHYFPDIPVRDIERLVEESVHSPVVAGILRSQDRINGTLSAWKLIALRSFVRLACPEVMIETGVAHGSSSAVILEALDANQKGRLYSIDLPVVSSPEGALQPFLKGYSFKREDISTVSHMQEVGWLVPAHLRTSWQLILGDSLVELPALLASLKRVDIFFHDSLHSYDHMMREFAHAWPWIPKNGFIFSDDIFLKCHAAMHDFSRKHQAFFKNFLQLGVLQK